MNRSERIFRFHRLLKGRVPVSRFKIQDELDCSHSTFIRTKDYLIDFFGAPIKYDPQLNGYYYDQTEGKFDLPGFWLSPDEIYALFVCHQVIEKSQEVGISSIIEPLNKKIESILQSLGHSPEKLKSRIKVMPLFSRSVKNGDFSKICSALVENEIIETEYYKRSCRKASHRRLHPQRLIHYKDNWYLAAFCEKQKDLRVFALEKMKVLQTIKGAKTIRKEDIDSFTEDGFGVFSGKATKTAVLRFYEPNTRWVRDEIWHKNQKMYSDGSDLILEVPYSNPTELMMEILRHGDGVVVESPVELKDAVIKKIENSLKKYQGMSLSDNPPVLNHEKLKN